jgi:dGTPase
LDRVKVPLQCPDFAAIVAAAAVAHDLGNPPFGHSGEDAISDFFKSADGNEYLKDLTPLQRMDLFCVRLP